MIPSSPLAHPWQTCLSKMFFFKSHYSCIKSSKNQPEAFQVTLLLYQVFKKSARSLSEDVAKWWLVVVDFHVWWGFVFNKRSLNEDCWKFIASWDSITKKFARWTYDYVNRFTSDLCEGEHPSSKPVLCWNLPCWKCSHNLEDLLERVIHFGCVIKQF